LTWVIKKAQLRALFLELLQVFDDLVVHHLPFFSEFLVCSLLDVLADELGFVGVFDQEGDGVG